MKNSIYRVVFFYLAITTFNINVSNAQTINSTFEVNYIDPYSSKYFRGNAHIVINHEEQDHFTGLKNAAKKNKSLTLAIKDLPSNAFKPSSSYDFVEIAKNGNSLKIYGVKVEENKQKGKKNKIRLSYNKVK